MTRSTDSSSNKLRVQSHIPYLEQELAQPSRHLCRGNSMSDEASDDEMHDADLTSPKATENGDAVQYGELNVSSLDSVAVGVAAGNIHLQSANAATLALPEASQHISCAFSRAFSQQHCTRLRRIKLWCIMN